MQVKKLMAKVLAPVAATTADKSTESYCSFIYGQPKMPSKLMSKVN